MAGVESPLQPAFFRRVAMPTLRVVVSPLSRLSATCRSIAMFSAALPVRTRLWSSSKAVSSTQ